MKISKKIALLLLTSLTITAPYAKADDWSSENAAVMAEQGCDPNVAKMISDTQQARISGETAMAHKLYDYIVAASHQAQSCLSNMLPSGIFQKPGIGDLWNTIGNQVCNQLNAVADPTLNTINGGIGNLTSTVNNTLMQNLSLGNGAINLGTVPLGFQTSSSGSLVKSGALNSLYQSGNYSYDNISSYINPKNIMSFSSSN